MDTELSWRVRPVCGMGHRDAGKSIPSIVCFNLSQCVQRQPTLVALVLSVLSSVLTLLSAHYTDHALGQPVMKALLVPSRFRQLNSYIGGTHNDLIITALKLYNVMSNFSGGHDRKAVLEGFGWEIKVRVFTVESKHFSNTA